MAASDRTIVDVYMVLQREIPSLKKRGEILDALAEVKGNRSFTQTLQKLNALHQRLASIAPERGRMDG